MPKAAKTPIKARPKPRPLRSSKPTLSKSLIDDEADESDDGVMVEPPKVDAQDDPFHLPADDLKGDPFEDASGEDYDLAYPKSRTNSPAKKDGDRTLTTPTRSPSNKDKDRVLAPVTPSPSNIRRGHPSTSKSASEGNGSSKTGVGPSEHGRGVIEVDTTSDEDMMAMDEDDSVFKKPAGVQPSALPPSLTTRSAASRLKQSVAVNAKRPAGIKNTVVAGSSSKDRPLSSIPVSMRAFYEVISAFSKHRSSKSDQDDSDDDISRVDHDQVALERGIRDSMAAAPRPSSPDWDPPYAEEVTAEVFSSPRTSSTSKRISAKRTKQDASVESDHNDSPSEEPAISAPKKRKTVSLKPMDPKYSDEKDLTSANTDNPVKRRKSVVSKVNTRSKSGTDVEYPLILPSGMRSTVSVARKGKAKAVEPFSDDEPVLDKAVPTISSLDGDNAISSSANKVAPGKISSIGSGTMLSYMRVKPLPIMSSTSSAEAPPLTMAQYLRAFRGDSPTVDETDGKELTPPINPDPVFLEDLETYKAYYDPEAVCGVTDVELQDVSLRPHYVGLPPLPKNRRIIPAFDRSRGSLEDIDWTTGGRVRFSSWFDQNPRMLAANSMGAMLFDTAEPNYINLSRVSPLALSSRVSTGSSQTLRLHVGDRVAICVSAVCCTESFLTAPRRLGNKTDRQKKWLSGVLHDQDWEQMEAMSSLVFNEHILYAQITDKAISFQTMISPADADQTPDRVTRSVPSRMFSSRSPGKPSNTTPYKSDRSKTLLAYNDNVPVYDARKTVIDFGADLDRLGEVLPLFTGEVPVGSFTVVGYTCSSYRGTVSGSNDRVAHISLNILWVIVCGTPGIRSSLS
ncbi:hypothetical protein C8F04DRAFT_1185149 [Mycena alexandri]|uniref:Uncharacterized protein n=1 Tax=Mycena alexandri TaxID=1745969 RepID=A0AAD6X2D1_9AGAR|nr:hypothetical protein C8F04DRAFT_1185149 [Mycena alexandri]